MGRKIVKDAGVRGGSVVLFDEWDMLVAEGNNILLLGSPKSGKTILADATGEIAAASGRTVRLLRRHNERREIPRGVQLIRTLRHEVTVPAKSRDLLIIDDLDESIASSVATIVELRRRQVVATAMLVRRGSEQGVSDWLVKHPVIEPLLDRFNLVCTIDWRRRRIERVWP